jgi:hypothetical protein
MDPQTSFISKIITCSALILAAVAKMNEKQVRNTCFTKEELKLEETKPEEEESKLK